MRLWESILPPEMTTDAVYLYNIKHKWLKIESYGI